MKDLVPPAVLTIFGPCRARCSRLLSPCRRSLVAPPAPPASAPKSRARNLRRRATLRKLYAAAAHGDTGVALHDKAIQTCDGDAVTSVKCPAEAPISLSEVDDKQLRAFSSLPPVLRMAPIFDVTAGSLQHLGALGPAGWALHCIAVV